MRVGPNSKIIDKIFGKDNESDPSPYRRNYVVTHNACKYILKYVKRNCDKTKFTRKETETYYGVSYLNGDIIVCDIKDRNASMVYFNGLKHWIEKSPYKKECRKIIRAIQMTFIDEKSFPSEDFKER